MRIKGKFFSVKRLLLITIVIIEILLYVLLRLNIHMANHLENYTSTMPDNNILSFSLEPGIYDHSITIELNNKLSLIGKNINILYTLDGNDPYFNNTYLNEAKEEVTFNPYVYTEPIKIDAKENDIVVVPIKAAVMINGHVSKIVEKTYIVSDGDINQYTDLPIISITANHHDLYDYYDGIMIKGYLGDKFVEDNEEGYNWGNFGVEREISSNITMLDQISGYHQYNNTNLLVTGGTSKLYSNKSFKIENKDNPFYISFDDNDTSYYKTLKLRSGSQDYYSTNIRSSVVSKYSNIIEFDGAPNTLRTVVYLNGKFYTITDTYDNNSKSNIKLKYNLPSSEIEEGGSVCNVASDLDSKEFEKYVYDNYDVDNLMKYSALEIIVNNTDWPGSNIKTWRFTGKKNTNNKYTDGKWRFIVSDVDITSWRGSEFFEGIYEDTLENIILSQYRGVCDFYQKLLENDNLRDKLFNEINNSIAQLYENNQYETVIDEELNKIALTSEFYLHNYKDLNYNVNEFKENIGNRLLEINSIIKKYY